MYIDNIASNGVTLNSAGKSLQIEVYEKHIKKLQEENKKLKSRIDKAIEYYKEQCDDIVDYNEAIIVKILKGEE